MSKTIISTVGTSLLGNAKRNDVVIDDDGAVQKFIKSDVQKASAESNALSRMVEEGDRLVFLHSDTPEGESCANALVQYYNAEGYKVTPRKIEGLNYNEKGFVQYGLRQFVRLLAKEIRDANRKQMRPVINATGGFKAEIAYATAVGLVFQTPVSYIHEKFGDIVTLPPTPIAWDFSLFVGYRDFFDWVDEEPRQTFEVKQRLKSMPDTVALLLEDDDDDGCTYLSPLGEAYLEAFKGEESNRRPLKISENAQTTLDEQDATTRGNFRNLLERLRKGGEGDWKRSAEALSGGVSKFPKGHSALRAFIVEREGILYVLELSGHLEERKYQKLIDTIRWSQYEHKKFEELP